MSTHLRNRKIVAAAGTGLIQRAVLIFCTLAQMPLLLHVLGLAKFGVWGAATSLAWLSGLLDIGVGMALVTLVARAMAKNDANEARRYVSGALCIGLALSLLLLAASFTAYLLVGGRIEGQAYLVAGVGLALNIPLSLANNIWMALQKGSVSSLWEAAQTILITVSIFIAASLTQDVRIYVAIVYSGLVVSNLGSLLHLFVRHRNLRPTMAPTSVNELREVASGGLQFFFWSITGSVTYMLDNVLALHLIGPEAAAVMAMASRICLIVASLQVVLTQPLWPAFTEAIQLQDWRWMRHAAIRSLALLVAVTIAISCILLLVGRPLMRLWMHVDFGFDPLLLWSVSLWILAHALMRVPMLLLNALLRIRYQILIFTAASLLAFTLKFALAPRLGCAGILLGTSLPSLCLTIPCFGASLLRWFHRHPTSEMEGT